MLNLNAIMRLRLITTLVFVFFCHLSATAQWKSVSKDFESSKVSSVISVGQNLFMGLQGGGVYRSVDNGNNWSNLNLENDFVYSLLGYDNALHAGSESGIDRSVIDNNVLWKTTKMTNGVSGGGEVTYTPQVNCFAVSGTNLYAGTDEGVFISTDKGVTWVTFNTFLINKFVTSLAVIGSNIFAATLGGGVYRTSTGSANWTSVNSGLSSSRIHSLAVSGTSLFAGSHNGLIFISTNDGASWTATNANFGSVSVTAILVNSNNLLASTSSVSGGNGIFHSKNNGNSWTAINTGLTTADILCLVLIGENIIAGTNGSGAFFRPISDFTTSIGSFTPTSGPVGTSVTISGTNFSTTPANNTVKFNGTTATITGTPTATSITTTVPTGAITGKITVTVAGQTATSSTDFTVTLPAPTITNFNPSSGLVGASVNITGTNFSTTPANNTVKFNGTTATVTASTATSITTTVPTGATTGKITITVTGYTATSSATDFIVNTAPRPVITSQNLPVSFTKGSRLTASITVGNVEDVSTVNFRSGGISEALATLRASEVKQTGNKFEKVLEDSELTDPLGLEYYFEVLDKSSPANSINSTTTNAIVFYPASSTSQELPGLSFGTQLRNYQIIAFPFDFNDKSVTSVFAALRDYDRYRWRLFDYTNFDNREYGGTFTNIEPGKGYWLIVRDAVTINPGASQVIRADRANPFVINLSAGWNLIGNPYNFNVLWSDVLAANSTVTGIDGVSPTLTTLNESTLSNTATVLPKFRGAFVKCTSSIALKIPVKYNSSAGRIGNVTEESASIDQPNWEVGLSLLQDGLRSEMAGIGMNTSASLKGKDKFDNERVPLPFDITELSSVHPEIASAFNKDVVPTQENFTWTFDVKHAQQQSNATLTWEKSNLNSPNKQLVLFDPATLQVVDMSTSSSYSITTLTTQLQFIYGEKDYVQNALDKKLPLLGSPYPNPAKEEVTIPFRVSDNYDQRQVQIKIYNAVGVEITTLLDVPLGKGSYEVSWHSQASTGLYFVKMQVAGEQSGIVKLILK
jgi:hypothetical protein